MITPGIPPPLLISLPGGLYVSGVVTWAVRLVNTLAARGIQTGLILHRSTPHHAPLSIPLHPGVRTFDLSHLPPLTECDGRLDDYIEAYFKVCTTVLPSLRVPPRSARGVSPELPHNCSPLPERGGVPRLILSPNLHGDDYGIAAAVSQQVPIAIVGWCHLDSAYDRAVLAHYEPCISRFITVSTATTTALTDAIPYRAGDIARIPYGIPIADTLPHRAPLIVRSRAPARSRAHPRSSAARTPRLLYVGRIEEGIKRISTLIAISDTLLRRGVPHELTLIGDGPAARDIDQAITTRPHITRLPPIGPHETAAHYAAADFFLLPSRAEGLSLAMLEAMGQGCIPIVTAVRSGPADAFDDGISGLLVHDANDPTQLADHFADTISHLLLRATPRTLPDMAAAAHAAARRFSIDRHADLVSAAIAGLAAEPARPWPCTRPASFTLAGIVPPDGPARLRAAIESLTGERLIIHGVGLHTRLLAPILAEYAHRITAFTDDNPLTHGTTFMDKPVLAPPGPPDATAIIISSHIHQQDMLERASIFGDRRIIALYPRDRPPPRSAWEARPQPKHAVPLPSDGTRSPTRRSARQE
ncbi:MAG: glycosyltransferase [Phycisphaerae bacterium]|nr:glycosyltransferase [Phycisphaerae bacterium]